MPRIGRPFAFWCLTGGWLLFTLIVLQVTQLSPMPFPFTNIDEHAHYSYTRDLLAHQHSWPTFNDFTLYDATTRTPTDALNYLNHPPTFYWLMALVELALPGINPVHYRLVSLGFVVIAMVAYARLGYALRLSNIATLLYTLVPILFYAPLQVGYYNNDSMAICGGALACLGSFYWFTHRLRRYGFLLMMAGVTLASVKLTALLLVGSYVGFSLLRERQAWRAVPRRTWVCAAIWTCVLTLPFAYFWLQYGSPAPHTGGQEAMLLRAAADHGWTPQPDTHFLQFVRTTLPQFADQFTVREFTFIPLLWLMTAFAFYLAMPQRLPTALASITRSALIATGITLTANLCFAYPRYMAYGWLDDMQLRYYFPLLPAYGAAMVGAYMRLSVRRKSIDSAHAS